MTPTHEQIAKRAFEIYMGSGCQPGRDVQNWVQAENELKKEFELQSKLTARAIAASAPVAPLPKLQRPLAAPAPAARAQITTKSAKRLSRKSSSRIKLN